jgi:hypothetical protein
MWYDFFADCTIQTLNKIKNEKNCIFIAFRDSFSSCSEYQKALKKDYLPKFEVGTNCMMLKLY